MKTIIIPYHVNYLSACLNAFISNVPESFTKDEVDDFENFLLQYETQEFNQNTHYYVMLKGGHVIGCGGWGNKNNKGIITLTWGLIHADYHKQNNGKSLLQFRLNEIQKHIPNAEVLLDTTQFSFGFFEKFGFKVTGFLPDYYTKGMHRYDMIWKPEIAS